MNMGIWVVGTSNQLFIRVLKLKQSLKNKNSFWQNYVLCDRSIFVLIILFVLTLASRMAVLYGNDAFSILMLSTKKGFFEKGFRFPGNVSKLKY